MLKGFMGKGCLPLLMIKVNGVLARKKESP